VTVALVVALLGAESTGKTTLSQQLGAALAAQGHDVAVVPEYLREFCNEHGRTPSQNEQRAIAEEQTRRIAAAAGRHNIVIADTTAVMIAVYSDHVFGDKSLYPRARADHARCGLTLLTAMDLPWLPDGLQRDGPQVRAPVDALVRAALARAGQPYSVIFGSGTGRLQAALACVERGLSPPAVIEGMARWQGFCERCGDADCERHHLPRAGSPAQREREPEISILRAPTRPPAAG
jgi:nicotinamide riboside kinase